MFHFLHKQNVKRMLYPLALALLLTPFATGTTSAQGPTVACPTVSFSADWLSNVSTHVQNHATDQIPWATPGTHAVLGTPNNAEGNILTPNLLSGATYMLIISAPDTPITIDQRTSSWVRFNGNISKVWAIGLNADGTIANNYWNNNNSPEITETTPHLFPNDIIAGLDCAIASLNVTPESSNTFVLPDKTHFPPFQGITWADVSSPPPTGGGGTTTPPTTTTQPTDLTERDIKIISLILASFIAFMAVYALRWHPKW